MSLGQVDFKSRPLSKCSLHVVGRALAMATASDQLGSAAFQPYFFLSYQH